MRSWQCFEEIADPLNLWRAWCDFQRGKRQRANVAAFALDADRHVHRLARELAAGTYRPGPYRLRRISDPKRRVVAAAAVRDRVVHHALHRVVAPRWNASFIDHSYACLQGRGTHRALLRFRDSLRRWRYVMHLDVKRYYYSIDRDILRRLLFRRLPEPRLRALIDRILDSGADLYRRPEVVDWLGWGRPATTGRGLPIGNLTSQWWGNVYLDELDHLATRMLRAHAYQRYQDDITFMGDDQDELCAQREWMAAWLRDERHLELKDPEAGPKRADRVHAYLGYRVSRRSLQLGHKARARLPKQLGARVGQPSRLEASIRSVGVGWMFG